MIGSQLFADDGPAVHIAPSPVFHVGGITITNSILYGWVSISIIILVALMVARHVKVKPQGGLVQIFEVGIEFITGMIESAFLDKKVARKYLPYFVTLFFFLLLNNWLGLLPGVGEAVTVNGAPLFRPFTADFNATFAIAVVTMATVYRASIKESGGVKKYFRHFFVGSPLNPMYLLIGVLEMLTDVMRTVSLSLRLFLNVTVGEVIIAVFSYLGHVAAPLTAMPFTLVELFVGALQAYIFTTLSVMYLASVANHAGHDEGHDNLTETATPETISLKPSGDTGVMG